MARVSGLFWQLRKMNLYDIPFLTFVLEVNYRLAAWLTDIVSQYSIMLFHRPPGCQLQEIFNGNTSLYASYHTWISGHRNLVQLSSPKFYLINCFLLMFIKFEVVQFLVLCLCQYQCCFFWFFHRGFEFIVLVLLHSEM